VSQHNPIEQAGIAHPQMAWTSFDRYARYAAITRAVRASLGAGRHRVLDVGDTAGHLHTFDDGLDVVGIDVQLESLRLPGTPVALADGTRLPFPEGAFDAVVSSDVLEHVAPVGRPAFLSELSRVSRDLVVVAAPFDTPGVVGVEELVRRYALMVLGTDQPQLEEHRTNGLPHLAETVTGLTEAGGSAITVGAGNLSDWLTMMLLRFQLEARPALQPLSEGYDLLYNHAFADRNDTGPFYRYLVIARSVGVPEAGPAPAVGAGERSSAVPALLAALIAADGPEAVRQDTVPRLDQLQISVGQLRLEFRGLETKVDSLIELNVSLAEQLMAVRAKLGRIIRPFRKAPASSSDPSA
jgi:hypothetical protein